MKDLNTLFLLPNSLALTNNSCSDKANMALSPDSETILLSILIAVGTHSAINESIESNLRKSNIFLIAAGCGPICRRENESNGANIDDLGTGTMLDVLALEA